MIPARMGSKRVPKEHKIIGWKPLSVMLLEAQKSQKHLMRFT